MTFYNTNAHGFIHWIRVSNPGYVVYIIYGYSNLEKFTPPTSEFVS